MAAVARMIKSGSPSRGGRRRPGLGQAPLQTFLSAGRKPVSWGCADFFQSPSLRQRSMSRFPTVHRGPSDAQAPSYGHGRWGSALRASRSVLVSPRADQERLDQSRAEPSGAAEAGNCRSQPAERKASSPHRHAPKFRSRASLPRGSFETAQKLSVDSVPLLSVSSQELRAPPHRLINLHTNRAVISSHLHFQDEGAEI